MTLSVQRCHFRMRIPFIGSAPLSLFLLKFCLAVVFVAASSFAQIDVNTLGGGRLTPSGPDYGFVDGDILQRSQFHSPYGIAVTGSTLYIADRDNGAIRKADLPRNRSTTILTGLKQPVAVALDSQLNLFFVTQGDGLVQRLDPFGTLTTVGRNLQRPTALAIDPNDQIYVTDLAGRLIRLDPKTGLTSVVSIGFRQPEGVAVLESGLVAVSDAGANQIDFMDPDSGALALKIGTGRADFNDGPAVNASFNQPHKLAKAPDGGVVVADRGNHRVRKINVDGSVSTIYGIDPSLWEGPECLDCDPLILPGWFDGPSEFAEAREPVGVTVSSDGKLYATEVFYHILREVTGANVTGSPQTGGAGGTNSFVVLPPTITPNTGYFPNGQTITVFNPNSSPFFPSAVYYTTDGSVPTTNSLRVVMNGNTGTIFWNDSLHDLTSLSVRAFLGATGSATVTGVRPVQNQIGVTRGMRAGIGSTVIIPIVVNLTTNDVLRSLAFVAQVTPVTPGLPPIPERFRALSINPETDFIQVAGAAESGKTSIFNVVTNVIKLPPDNARRIGIAFISTNSGFMAKDFAAVGMLSVPIPPAAFEGGRYRVEVTDASAANDRNQGVHLAPMDPQFIEVQNLFYTVGDTAPATWYNEGDFGDGDIQINDANNVFDASLGLRTPFLGTDVFDAMDVYPEDSPGVAGGDGQIRFLDWQTTLQRALRFDVSNFKRKRTAGGGRTAEPAGLINGTPDLPASSIPAGDGSWTRNALFKAGSADNVGAGAKVTVPVSVEIAPGGNLSGLEFRIVIDGAPALTAPARFELGLGMPPLIAPFTALPANQVGGAWSLFSFDPPLEGKRVLGQVAFTIPINAPAGAHYHLRFAAADGSPSPIAPYEFDTISGDVWIGVSAPVAGFDGIISDEWKAHYFGGTLDTAALPNADPDGDGMPNWAEYLAGTSPVDAGSGLSVQAFGPDRGGLKTNFTLRWMTVPGKNYAVESATDLRAGNWTEAARLSGTGQLQEFIDPNPAAAARFFRVRLK